MDEKLVFEFSYTGDFYLVLHFILTLHSVKLQFHYSLWEARVIITSTAIRLLSITFPCAVPDRQGTEDTVTLIVILLEKGQGRQSTQESGHQSLAFFIKQLFHNKLCHCDHYLGKLL